jgi:hypothetical protein
LKTSSALDCHSSGEPGVEIRKGFASAQLARAKSGTVRAAAPPARIVRRPMGLPKTFVILLFM